LLSLFLLTVSMLGAVYAFAVLRNNNIENQQKVEEIAQLESQIKALNAQGEKIQQQLTPEQQNLLIAAHKLISNKTFVWSRLFSDLEAVMPNSVSASRIVVRNVYDDGGQVKAELEFAVLSADYSSVQSMIDSMNNSGLFQAELRGQDLQKTERMTFSEYTLRLIYSPSRGLSTPQIDIAQNDQGGAQ
jgi:Tfp pilus assembly protein PilN